MSVKEFWEDDPDLFWAYRFSYVNRKKQEQEEMNIHCWLQGAYFFEAVSVAVSNALGKRKYQYSNQPYHLDKKEEEQKVNTLEMQLKERAMKVQSMLKGNKNGK